MAVEEPTITLDEAVAETRACLALYIRGGESALQGPDFSLDDDATDDERKRFEAIPGIRRRRPALINVRDPQDDGTMDYESRPNPELSEVTIVNRATMIAELNADIAVENEERAAAGRSLLTPVPLDTPLDDLTGHWCGNGAIAEDEREPLEEGDVVVDMCGLEAAVVRGEEGKGIEITFVWCHDYPARLYSIDGVGDTARARPLTNQSQPMVCAAECMEHLESYMGGELMQQHRFTHELVFCRYEHLSETFQGLDPRGEPLPDV